MSECNSNLTIYPTWKKNNYNLRNLTVKNTSFTMTMTDGATATFSDNSDFYAFNPPCSGENCSVYNMRAQAVSTTAYDLTDYSGIYFWVNGNYWKESSGSNRYIYVGVMPSRSG